MKNSIFFQYKKPNFTSTKFPFLEFLKPKSAFFPIHATWSYAPRSKFPHWNFDFKSEILSIEVVFEYLLLGLAGKPLKYEKSTYNSNFLPKFPPFLKLGNLGENSFCRCVKFFFFSKVKTGILWHKIC